MTNGVGARCASTFPDYHDVPKSQLIGNLAPLAEGGEGLVFSHGTGPSRQIYKEYKPTKRNDLDVPALRNLVDFARVLPPDDARWLARRAAWPTGVVTDAQGPSGVLMSWAPAEFFLHRRRHDGTVDAIPAKFELLLNGSKFLQQIDLDVTDFDRIGLLRSVAETVAFLHLHHVAVGDFSCRNMLFRLDATPSSYLIDCDSMRVGDRSALPPGETPDWEVPDGETLATSASDVYKFSLLVLRLFTGAQHHRDPNRMPPDLPAELRTQVRLGLQVDSTRRPSMVSWLNVLARASAKTSRTPRSVSPATRRPPALRSPTVWHCRYDFRLNSGDRCQTCQRPEERAALEVLGPLPRSVPNGPARLRSRLPAATSPAPTISGLPQPPSLLPVRRSRPFTIRRVLVMIVGLLAACGVTFALLVVAKDLSGGPVHTAVTWLSKILPLVYVVYTAIALYLTATEPSQR